MLLQPCLFQAKEEGDKLAKKSQAKEEADKFKKKFQAKDDGDKLKKKPPGKEEGDRLAKEKMRLPMVKSLAGRQDMMDQDRVRSLRGVNANVTSSSPFSEREAGQGRLEVAQHQQQEGQRLLDHGRRRSGGDGHPRGQGQLVAAGR
jgi:hypothetical protein